MITLFISRFKEQTIKAKMQFLIVFLCILLAVIGSFVLRESPETIVAKGDIGNKILVDVIAVKPAKLDLEILKTGTLKARNMVSVVPEVSGRVTEVSPQFRSGNSFGNEQTLFQIEPLDYQLMVDRAEANLKRAETELMIEEAEAKSAALEWKSLHGNKEIPPLVARIPQMEQAKANLKSAQAELDDAQLDLKRTSFSFPYNGKVVQANVEVGQYLRSGNEYGTVYTDQSLEIEVPIEREAANWFEPGKSKAIIYVTLQGKRQELSGTVERVSAQLDQETRFSKIFVQPNQEHLSDLYPGMFVEVKLIGPAIDNVWKIPNQAIQDGNIVWLVDRNQQLKKLEENFLYFGEDFSYLKGSRQTLKVVKSRVLGAAEGMAVELVES